MRIAVLGAGAIGCYYGGLLAKENMDVHFIAKGRTLERLRDNDLIIKSIYGDFSLPVQVSDATHLENDPHFDYILLAIKSTALEAVIPELKALIGPKTKIICLLNGIGNEERLADEFGAEHVVGGSAFISIIREAPGVVNHVGEGRLVIGEWKTNDSSDSTLPELAKVFQNAGIRIQLTDHIRQIKWEKLLWNITYNPLTALTRTRVGEALADPDLTKLLQRVKDEFVSVADHAGISIGRDYQENLLFPDEKVQNHKTSMLQDFENGREMELDAILGFVIKTAETYDVSVTTIETIYHLLRFMDRQNQKA
ncbi:ketopantoate reductase family protein [Sporolactobacillus laevolacticus]|uniref:2-dehydropantoate 2-reductase n=1 Tax=Sporolactobacillus laevolacticus DSM 442 TaxID=1395513 RepID=V6IY11_9BACL|nr:2-dehydropantoate 2-reductase [Sporolactobacillus laevolacticus]EST12328.1 2-dehydropantoate 2-reductase [Sporolactobacillus laevolacticus DSM 442]MDN3955345.1 2-dehydropantoate 2-reductase [Sporolactobacillus laevolacticus]